MKFEVHRIGFSRGTDIDFSALPHRQRLREIQADYPPPSDEETEISEALDIAQRKALAVPAVEFEAVMAADVKPLLAELVAAVPTETRKRRAVLDEEFRVVDARVRQCWIKAGLISITGGDLDGMTPDQLLDYGPPALAQEIYEALVSDGKLQGRGLSNLSLPTTSGPVADGPSPSTTAPSAEVPQAAGTLNATASSTSPAT